MSTHGLCFVVAKFNSMGVPANGENSLLRGQQGIMLPNEEGTDNKLIRKIFEM